MCGICGGFAFTDKGRALLDRMPLAVDTLKKRGPDGQGIFRDGPVILGHTRLAVIDTSAAAAQPFSSDDGRYTMVFNGEIFNYRELRSELENAGENFRTQSDTEVLLRLFIREGEKALHRLNGFFAFAVWDKARQDLFVARDRYGEKPLYACSSPDGFFFASEMKALLALGIPRSLDHKALLAYLHLNYIPPAGRSILEDVETLEPGETAQTGPTGTVHRYWYELPRPFEAGQLPAQPEKELAQLLETAVQRRLVSDVPLGAFLSGGVDSSIVAALAARHTDKLRTFSIGFPDTPHFDETGYARQVAKHIGAEHTVFEVTEKEMLDSIFETLDYIDEPFADSSAIAVSILAKKTRTAVTVALSGDGADELFAGYNKHRAEFMAQAGGMKNQLIRVLHPLWKLLPASRSSQSGNRIRQLRRFAEGLALTPGERYWRWAGFTGGQEALSLLREHGTHNAYSLRNAYIKDECSMNDVLRADFRLVLAGDMLVKVDRMSMCHGLEVRSPFLDHELAEFVLRLPSHYKIDAQEQKKILKSAFRNLLPADIFSRRKQGFEVPLHRWLTGELRGLTETLLNEKFIREQGIFSSEPVQQLRRRLHTGDPGDAAARIWGLLVFQYWWKKYFSA